MKPIVISILLVLLITACSGSGITVSLGAPTATPTATDTPTSVPTATPNLEATATAQAQATAQASATARAVAFATGEALQTATAQAQATARFQATTTAAAQGTATAQAFVAGINSIAAGAKKFYGPAQGKLEGQNLFSDTTGYVRNFVLEVRFFNPGDRAVHPWDFALTFRYVSKYENYVLLLDSNGGWRLWKPDKGLADAIQMTRLASGLVPSMDLAPTGSNLVRVVVQDKAAHLFVNGQFVTTMDISVNNSAGDMAISTGNQYQTDFPGLSMRYQDLVVSSLP